MRRNQNAYDRSNSQLYGAFKYPILKNDDAITLVTLIDDCVYRALKLIDDATDWTRRRYATLAVDAAFKETTKSFTSIGDSLLFSMTPVLINEDWLDRVRNEVGLYRGHWISSLSAFMKKYGSYLQYSVDESKRKEAEEIELELDASVNSLYGVIAEVKHLMERISCILDRMVRPYLRKIVSLAKTYAREPEAFFENYQNGYHGVLMAIGKYDVRIGAYAFIVELWLKSRMINGITAISNSVTMPERIWKHKRLFDKNPNLSIEQLAKRELISPEMLRDSMHLLDVRNAMSLIEENDENADSLECYHDRQADKEHDLSLSRQQLSIYSKKLKPFERVVLSVTFDVDMHTADSIDPIALEREAARQLYSARLALTV